MILLGGSGAEMIPNKKLFPNVWCGLYKAQVALGQVFVLRWLPLRAMREVDR